MAIRMNVNAAEWRPFSDIVDHTARISRFEERHRFWEEVSEDINMFGRQV